METQESETNRLPVLTRTQRRVLGVLVEKGLTTPEYYPLTLKALTTGCNQKSNRDPVMTLTELGFVGEVHTDGGRAPRYRHYLRHKLTLTEPQIAILTELLLRGRQQLGELRSRASRMVRIENQTELRSELAGLL